MKTAIFVVVVIAALAFADETVKNKDKATASETVKQGGGAGGGALGEILGGVGGLVGGILGGGRRKRSMFGPLLGGVGNGLDTVVQGATDLVVDTSGVAKNLLDNILAPGQDRFKQNKKSFENAVETTKESAKQKQEELKAHVKQNQKNFDYTAETSKDVSNAAPSSDAATSSGSHAAPSSDAASDSGSNAAPSSDTATDSDSDASSSSSDATSDE